MIGRQYSAVMEFVCALITNTAPSNADMRMEGRHCKAPFFILPPSIDLSYPLAPHSDAATLHAPRHSRPQRAPASWGLAHEVAPRCRGERLGQCTRTAGVKHWLRLRLKRP